MRIKMRITRKISQECCRETTFVSRMATKIVNFKLFIFMKRILTALRVSHYLSASQMARKIGVSPSYISKLENGEKIPSDTIIQKYSKAFHIPENTIRLFDDRFKKAKYELDNQDILLMVLNEMKKLKNKE